MNDDKYEWVGIAFFIFVVFLVMIFFSFGIWGFVELVQWITSK